MYCNQKIFIFVLRWRSERFAPIFLKNETYKMQKIKPNALNKKHLLQLYEEAVKCEQIVKKLLTSNIIFPIINARMVALSRVTMNQQ